MWMMPQLKGELYELLNERGLTLTEDEIYSNTKPSLHRAITRINIGNEGGGTGSFVSDQGLILTNHHVAYDAITSVSSTDQNYLMNGFYAQTSEDEIPVPGYTVHIPLEQIDITNEVTSRLDPELNYQEEAEQIEVIKQQIVEEYTRDDDDIIAEINDIWSGNRYILSSYQIIRDVRLVYAPEEAIGKFGGDIDNWMWPRHTGDFTFLRAYVAQDGTAQEYQPQNVPYQPDYTLPIKNGLLNPGDFTMTLGFPGTTYRQESSFAFDFYEHRQFPVLEKAFRAYLNGLESASPPQNGNTELAAEKASIANSLKYYNGIREGFKKHNITQQKSEFDDRFHEWVKSDSLRNLKYGRVLQQLEQSYSIAGQTGDVLYLSFYALQFSKILQTASLFDEIYSTSPSDEVPISDEEKLMMYDFFRQLHQAYNPDSERIILRDLLFAFAELPEDRRPLIYYRFFDGVDTGELQHELQQFIDRQFSTSVLTDTSAARDLIFSEYNPTEPPRPDSLYLIANDILEMFEQSRENYVRHFTYLLPAQKRYVEGVREMNPGDLHHADANFTLRLSAGEIMGYKPNDGVYNLPFTTLSGMFAKNRGEFPFSVPEKLTTYSAEQADFSSYENYSGDLILNFLSTNDITGGNSGSPVLNRHGELIGLAFDGNIEGIVSDYFFIPELSRTLSVDIRFILFMMDEIDNTDRLLDELRIISD
jgi:hypothetical protein